MISTGYHYTACLPEIKREKRIEAHTPIINGGVYNESFIKLVIQGLTDQTKRIISLKSKYICCLPELIPAQWAKSGALEALINCRVTSLHNDPELQGVVSFPIDEEYYGFVLECSHSVADGTNLENRRNYLNSAIPLDDYNGEHKIPEIWIGHDIVRDLKFQNFVELEPKLAQSGVPIKQRELRFCLCDL